MHPHASFLKDFNLCKLLIGKSIPYTCPVSTWILNDINFYIRPIRKCMVLWRMRIKFLLQMRPFHHFVKGNNHHRRMRLGGRTVPLPTPTKNCQCTKVRQKFGQYSGKISPFFIGESPPPPPPQALSEISVLEGIRGKTGKKCVCPPPPPPKKITGPIRIWK